MQKHRLVWLVGIALFVFSDVVLALVVTLKHEPNFYRQNRVPPSDSRKALSDKLMVDFGQMVVNIRHVETWHFSATEMQINCFLEEAFVRHGEAESLHKLGITSPCVSLEGDHMRLAFRFGKGWFSTVVSYDLKVWLVPKEPNVVAIQILGARAGAMPISSHSILSYLKDFATEQGCEVSLYRYESTPVSIVKLKPNEVNPVSTLQVLKIDGNTLRIHGRTSDHALPPPQPKSPNR